MKIAPLYLSAREAAAELSISPASLYAYVSRGLIRSEPGPTPRGKRYRAEDVRALKARRAPGQERSGLRSFDAEFPALDSAVSTITEDGPLYRGVLATALAERGTLEQAATLLWDANGADPFARDNLPVVSPAMADILKATAQASPVERAIAVLALAADADPRAFNRVPDGRAAIGARILRLIAAAMTGTNPSALPLHRQLARAWTHDAPQAEDLLRRALVLLAEHELNPSTFTVRCAAATGISLFDAVIAGLVALKGPLHGGVGPRAAHLVAQFAEGDVARIVRERVALGERFPGFGHGVYKGVDPRARMLLDTLARAGADRRLTHDAPSAVFEGAGEGVNIDYAMAVLALTLRMPHGSELALFALARCTGWIAHASEQLQSGGLIRPRARYTGPSPGRMSGVRR